MKSGDQCVMTHGTILMPVLLAGSWDSLDTVCYINYHISIAHNIHKQYCIADAVARANAFYGQGSGPINIDDPGCTGSEQRLIDCLFSPVHDCVHSEDAGVDCTPDCKSSL